MRLLRTRLSQRKFVVWCRLRSTSRAKEALLLTVDGPARSPPRLAASAGLVVVQAREWRDTDPRMRRHNFKAAADDDSLPVMVPRNDKAAVPISLERVRRPFSVQGMVL